MPLVARIFVFSALLLGILLSLLIGCGVDAPPAALQLLDLQGREVDPIGMNGSKATVFIFVRTDCPISNRYAPEVQRLYEKFSKRGITFYLVYADPDQSVETISQHLKEYNYPLKVLRDLQHQLVKLTGAKVTPEAAVFISNETQRQMVYRGRIDNRYVDFGKTRAAPTRHDVEEVLEEILEGKFVPYRATDAVGCFISDLRS